MPRKDAFQTDNDADTAEAGLHAPLYTAAMCAFGRHLAALRKAKRWSQEKLALESGMARSYLGGIERGQRNPSLKNLVRLANTLDIPMSLLVNFRLESVERLHMLAPDPTPGHLLRAAEPSVPYARRRRQSHDAED